MWSQVFGNLQSDLSEFAKELSVGVKQTTSTTSVESPDTHSEDGSLQNDIVGTSHKNTKDSISQNKTQVVDTDKVEMPANQSTQLDKTFLLDWASSADEDDDDDDIAAEWEQVTNATVKQSDGALPSATVSDEKSNLSRSMQVTGEASNVHKKTHVDLSAKHQAEVESLRSKLLKSQQRVDEQEKELQQATVQITMLNKKIENQNNELRSLHSRVKELTELSAKLREATTITSSDKEGQLKTNANEVPITTK